MQDPTALTRAQMESLTEKDFTPDYYVYTAEFGQIAQGDSQTFNLKLDSDSLFELHTLNYFCTDSAGTTQQFNSQIIPNMTFNMVIANSGRNLMNTPMPISMVAGSGMLPAILGEEKVFAANSSVNLTLANFSAADDYANVFVVLIGRKLFLRDDALRPGR